MLWVIYKDGKYYANDEQSKTWTRYRWEAKIFPDKDEADVYSDDYGGKVIELVMFTKEEYDKHIENIKQAVKGD